MIRYLGKLRWPLYLLVATILSIGVGLGLWFGLKLEPENTGSYRRTNRAAVVANGVECAKIGCQILEANGSAADAAIATLFCEGLTCPQSMGLGGGSFLTLYIRETGFVETMNAREVAPAASHKDMFVNVTTVTGIKSVAVPGELKGYWELHQKYGKLKWATLIKPTIDLCRTGFAVSEFLARSLNQKSKIVKESPSLREVYVNPETGEVWQKGDIVKHIRLAETLEIISVEGADALYTKNGTIAKGLVQEISDLGGIVTMEDLINYKVEWNQPERAQFSRNMTLYSVPLPGSGSLLTFIVNILNGFISSGRTVTDYQRLIETFKYAYAKRTDLADPLFVPEVMETVNQLRDYNFAMEIKSKITDNATFQDYKHYGANYFLVEDHGTAHVSILAPNGDAISVTSTVNTLFGSKVRSVSTGFILNNQMDDFATPNITNAYGVPASPANFIMPGKRPMSSMCPSIIINADGDVEIVIGAAGGTKITSSIAYILTRYFWFGETLTDAIESKRVHHQLTPMAIETEEGFDTSILSQLEAIGHEILEIKREDGFAAAIGISQRAGHIEAVFDWRRHGSSSIV